MNKINRSLIIIMLVCVSMAFGACSSKPAGGAASHTDKVTVTDALGRQVEINSAAKRVVAVGPGALRLCCYFNSIDMIVGVEQMDKNEAQGKPYVMANPSLASLPVIGPGGPNNAPDPEKILAAKPEVIFTTYASDKAAADSLQAKTGIPVAAISYGKTSVFSPEVYSSLRLIGKLTGKEKRAEELVEYMEKCKNDLDSRTKDIPDGMKPSAYIGGLGMKGAHGIESTQGRYALFDAVHANNVADETGKTGTVMIDKEKLLQWNPDKIFIDGSGLQMVKEDYSKNPSYYGALSAFKNGEIYSQLPYNFYTTNIDTAMADAYYIGKVLYPGQFEDVEPGGKANEIYKFLVGQELYAQMAESYGEFKKLTLP
ncbi:iron complex transport system substrate-binding protein [Anaerobacterium chartisolvens]|uniref:Iron complex transport system substrate-binding protein n=1 Tax=Anaerobacterium chartisolvens TaxID=1297424 RepID=A0A369BFS9_9FIRM|nr:iron ABC transporter substrate-binding protein [Anaerobacterium chartisolvens]RCX20115.1 iron complex transport system substrate-binding protein [Anaerobacterium chartisolvens]